MNETIPIADKAFICAGTDDGGLFFNIFQIVAVNGITEDRIVLHMSDGNSYVLNGRDAIPKLMSILSQHAMTLDGDPLIDALERLKSPESKLTLIKPEREP